MLLIPHKWFQKGEYLTNSRFFMWGHGGHVGVHNNREIILLGILFYQYANLERHSTIVLYIIITVLSREFNLQVL